ncbi:hypothetical protein BLA29_007713, partial [Euroglyphus maynei]
RGLLGKLSPSTPKREHWLDHADLHFNYNTILEVKTLMRILFLYIPLPIFWALFDQQSSRWTLQALRLNGDFGFYTIKPDQIQVINPVLIVGFIPIFENLIYPIINRIGLKKPLRRMVIGGILASLSFAVCGILQTRIEKELPPTMDAGTNHLMLIGNPNPSWNMSILNEYNSSVEFEQNSLRIYASIPREELNGKFLIPMDKNITLKDDKTLVMYFVEQQNNQTPLIFTMDNVLTKPRGSGAQIE